MPRKTARRGNLSSAKFAGKLLAERRKLIDSRDIGAHAKALAKYLRRPPILKGIRGARLEVRQGVRLLGIILEFGGKPLAYARVYVEKNKGNLEATIDEVQGLTKGREETGRFREAAGVFWNVALAQSVIDAAHAAGFDRVKLCEITAKRDYKMPVTSGFAAYQYPKSAAMMAKDIRKAMKEMYGFIRKDCGFSKREGDYWIREFA